MLLITHDMGIVAEVADEVAVMRRGEIVDLAPSTRFSMLRSIPIRASS